MRWYMIRLIILIIIQILAISLNITIAKEPSIRLEGGFRFGYFHTSLNPYGEWIEIEPGLHVWQPSHISHHWRPYLIGRWLWTDYGWYWMSHEPFGWITYHYGRWYNDDFYGWIWIPDNVWGPAWVEWRHDDEYIGWAPLPPHAVFHFDVGIHFSSHWRAPVHYWNFIRYRHFGTVIRYRDTAPIERTRHLIETTRPSQNYQVDRNRPINRGVDRTFIEQRGSVRIRSAEIHEAREHTGERLIRSDKDHQLGRIEVYRPDRNKIDQVPERVRVRRAERSLSIDLKSLGIQRESQQKGQSRDRDLRQEESSRIIHPRVEEQQPQRDHQEMRRELLQRYERQQNPVPPVRNESRGTTIERKKNDRSSVIPERSTRENRSGQRIERKRSVTK